MGCNEITKRQIPKGHRFSIKKTTTVHEKTTSLRSCLRWQPTGRILKTVCLRWVPTGKTFASSTTKVESKPPNGSNADIPNQCESEQALNVGAGTLLSTVVLSKQDRYIHDQELEFYSTLHHSNAEDISFKNKDSVRFSALTLSVRQYFEQPESINDTYVVEKFDSNVIPDSSDMCDNEGKANQNAEEYEDKRVVLANLIANLKLDTDENKKIQKQLNKVNASLTHELNEFKFALEESNDIHDSFKYF
ncbi:hypothetical protein Tco_1081377 [Tanacetum coccineum]|uniref:Uncharacterized protein n=1 Tax=Tanacetum coccineum TaxID=301880 RepID=A0ABQ5HZ03_9ASTR